MHPCISSGLIILLSLRREHAWRISVAAVAARAAAASCLIIDTGEHA